MVKPDIQSCALYIKTSTVSDLQNLQPCQTGWGMKSMASGRSSSNHLHLKVKTCTLLLICQDVCWEAVTCSLKLCLPWIKIDIFDILCSTSPLQSSSMSSNLFPFAEGAKKAVLLHRTCGWKPTGENDPASNGGMNDILNTTHSKQ